MNVYKLISFSLYFAFVLGVGIYFFVKHKDKGEKDYFLGGRNMGGWVSALSAGASDMSAWVLMGLPGAIFISGVSEVWISIGLLTGTICAWVFVAPRLRRFAIKANDSITIPEFLSNRFKATSPVLRISCAVIFIIGYLVYAASSVYACGELLHLLIPALPQWVATIIAAAVILVYTLLGGFRAVSWTDFFQGMLMLGALMLVPIVMLIVLKTSGAVEGANVITAEHYFSLLKYNESGNVDVWNSIANILTGFGWGLGYFGMPHILVRYMAIKSEREVKKSRIIGISWTALILTMTTVLALVAHEYLGDTLVKADKNQVFVRVVDHLFTPYGALALISGLLISAIVAASMSTADSQLLASSSAFSSDFYKTTIKKNASNKELLWVGRISVIALTVLATGLAIVVYFAKIDGIMSLVSAAWSIFGAAFGPVVLLALFWKRFNFKGAVASIITGFAVSILWMVLFNLEYYGFDSVIFNTSLYELVPGFIVGLIVGIVVSLCTKKPSKEVEELFDSVGKCVETEEKIAVAK
ncbi:MAG: sodium/proline symporter [Clostridia bacterium]|nr:sodium/proline symporter [Clostridia bacterium]